jgi:signal peptidase II
MLVLRQKKFMNELPVSRRPAFLTFGCLFVLFVFDRITKALAFRLGETTVLPHDFGLVFAKNPGVAFSIPIPNSVALLFSILIAVILLGVCIRTAFRHQLPHAWAFGLLGLGALSNAIDRMRYGAVIDFIKVPVLPIFNIADILIVVGVSILVLLLAHNSHPYARSTSHRNPIGH